MFKEKLTSNPFLILLISSFIIMTLITYGAARSSYTFAQSNERGRIQANNTRIEIQQKALTINVQDIFINNFLLGLPLIIPGFGFVFFGKILINTGLTLGVLAYSFNISPELYLLGSYIPIGIIEMIAFSSMSAESIMLVHSVVQRNFRERLKQKTWKHFLLFTLLLLFGAILEIVIIKF